MVLDQDGDTVIVTVGSVRVQVQEPALAEALRRLQQNHRVQSAVAAHRARVRGCCLWAADPRDPDQAPWVETQFCDTRTCGDFDDVVGIGVGRGRGLTQVTGMSLVRLDGTVNVLVRKPKTPAGRALYFDTIGLVREDVTRLTDVVAEVRRVEAWCGRCYDPSQVETDDGAGP